MNYSFFFLFSSFLWSEFQLYACPLALLFPLGSLRMERSSIVCHACSRGFLLADGALRFFIVKYHHQFTLIYFIFGFLSVLSLIPDRRATYLVEVRHSNRNKVSFPTSTRHHQPQSQPQPQHLSHWQQVISELGSPTGRFLFCILDYCHLMTILKDITSWENDGWNTFFDDLKSGSRQRWIN